MSVLLIMENVNKIVTTQIVATIVLVKMATQWMTTGKTVLVSYYKSIQLLHYFTDINECKDNICEHSCSNTVPFYDCFCNNGYKSYDFNFCEGTNLL